MVRCLLTIVKTFRSPAPTEKAGRISTIANLGTIETETDPRAHYPANPATSVSSKFNKRSSLKKNKIERNCGRHPKMELMLHI